MKNLEKKTLENTINIFFSHRSENITNPISKN